MTVTGVAEGVAGNAAWAAGKKIWQRATGNRIEIVSPRPGALLDNGYKERGMTVFKVDGRLRKLTDGHEIWLLVQEESTNRVWPQGFGRVQYDRRNGDWTGKVNIGGTGYNSIIAVVAPPTSQQLFTYFQMVGDKLLSERRDGDGFDKHIPLDRVPSECINRDLVQIRVA